MGRVKTKIPNTKLKTSKKTNSKTLIGACYLEINCKGVLFRKVTKTQCLQQDGKSWKKIDGLCEKL